jgi:hypothetical protein
MARIDWRGFLFFVACAGCEPTQEGVTPSNKPAGAACRRGDECAGGTCLGAPGQPEEGNPRFTGGYCSSSGCAPNTQEGCGADEFCVEGGPALGGYCVEMCSRADGLKCDREDHVCLGLGSFGGCFSEDAVECDRPARTGCEPAEICVRIGFDDDSPLGRCETVCDPMNDRCIGDTACYFIRTYSAAICGTPGTTPLGAPCACDKCCAPGLACALEGADRRCARVCEVATGAGCSSGERCAALKVGSPWGGCVAM